MSARKNLFHREPVRGPMRIARRLVLALDVTDARLAASIAEATRGHVDAVKVGWPLVLAAGLGIVSDLSRHGYILCDFKVADIPNTNRLIVEQAVAAGAGGIICQGFPGEDSVRACVDAAARAREGPAGDRRGPPHPDPRRRGPGGQPGGPPPRWRGRDHRRSGNLRGGEARGGGGRHRPGDRLGPTVRLGRLREDLWQVGPWPRHGSHSHGGPRRGPRVPRDGPHRHVDGLGPRVPAACVHGRPARRPATEGGPRDVPRSAWQRACGDRPPRDGRRGRAGPRRRDPGGTRVHAPHAGVGPRPPRAPGRGAPGPARVAPRPRPEGLRGAPEARGPSRRPRVGGPDRAALGARLALRGLCPAEDRGGPERGRRRGRRTRRMGDDPPRDPLGLDDGLPPRRRGAPGEGLREVRRLRPREGDPPEGQGARPPRVRGQRPVPPALREARVPSGHEAGLGGRGAPMRIVPLAADSLGARSMATLVETPDVTVVLDPSVRLAPVRYGLPPHPLEEERQRALWRTIRDAAKRADVLTVSHYHYDHHNPDAPSIFKGKLAILKDGKFHINRSQRERAGTFVKALEGYPREVQVAR